MKTAAGLAGFTILALSPSFVDWQQSPDKRKAMVVFYVLALALIWYGVLKP